MIYDISYIIYHICCIIYHIPYIIYHIETLLLMMVNIEFESLGRGACTMAASSIYQIFGPYWCTLRQSMKIRVWKGQSQPQL